MKIYEYRLVWNKAEITIKEIEAEEKPKTFIFNHTRLNKENLNKLDGYVDKMYSLSNDAIDLFKRLLIERHNKKIKACENTIKHCKSEIEKINVAVTEVLNYEKN